MEGPTWCAAYVRLDRVLHVFMVTGVGANNQPEGVERYLHAQSVCDRIHQKLVSPSPEWVLGMKRGMLCVGNSRWPYAENDAPIVPVDPTPIPVADAIKLVRHYLQMMKG